MGTYGILYANLTKIVVFRKQFFSQNRPIEVRIHRMDIGDGVLTALSSDEDAVRFLWKGR